MTPAVEQNGVKLSNQEDGRVQICVDARHPRIIAVQTMTDRGPREYLLKVTERQGLVLV